MTEEQSSAAWQGEMFRLLAENVQDYAIFILDPQGRVRTWNVAAATMFGYCEAEVAGQLEELFLTDEDRRANVPHDDRKEAVTAGRAEGDRWLVRKDGSRFWSRGVLTPLTEPGGKFHGFARILRDHTADKLAADARETRFRELMDQAPFSVQVFSADGRIVRVNRAWEKLWGVTQDAIPEYNVLHDPQLEQLGIMPLLRRAFGGETVQIPAIRYDPNATLADRSQNDEPARWVAAVAYPLKDPEGHVREVVFVHEDRTARVRAEQATQESEEQFRTGFEMAPVGNAQADPTGRLIRVNRKFCELTGYSEQELLGMSIRDLHHPDDWQRERPTVQAMLRGEIDTYTQDKRYLRKDGNIVWVNVTASIIRGADGAPLRTLGVAIDLTERRRADEALRQSEGRFRRLMEANFVGVGVSDNSGCWVDANEELLRIMGYTREDLEKGEARWVGMTPEQYLPLDRRGIEEAKHRGACTPYEKEYVRRDGTRIPVLLGYASLENEDQFICFVLDITARRRAEEELRNANRRKDEFLAMLAHELRNPLAPIRSGLDLLSLTGADGEVVGPMQQQVSHLVRLVDDLLDVSRIMRGRVELRKEPVELTAVLKRATDTILPQMQNRRQRLSTTLPAEPVRLMADPVRLAQVVSNLLHNASKYSDEGAEVHLSANCEGDLAVVEVSDEGVGIDADLLPRVFDLFTQATTTIDRSQGGLGIGLTVVKSLVEMHEGTVVAESGGAGQGSRFIVRLPTLAEEDAAEVILQAAAATPSRRVLVVDDNVPAAKMLARLLERLDGHQAFLAYDGEEAIAAARQHRPDIILLDIGLPKLDGYEVARRLRSQPDFATTLIVALTGYGTEEDRRKSIEAGCDEHLVKPPGVEDLQRVLNHERFSSGSS